MQQHKLIILGAGALGLRFASGLSSLNPKVVTHGEAQGTAIVREFSSDQELPKESQLEVQSWNSLAALPPHSVVLVCSKIHALDGILEKLKSLVTGTEAIVLCQNGIGIFDRALEFLPASQVIRLMARFGSLKIDTWSCRPSGPIAVTLAASPAAQEKLELVGELIASAGGEVATAATPEAAEWEKTAVNIVTNSIATLLNAPNSILLDDPSVWEAVTLLLSECAQVAAADGVELSDSLTPEQIRAQIERYRTNTNSTLVDFRAGRRSELPWLIGAMVSRAKRHRIPVPAAEAVALLLEGIERQGLLRQR